MLVSTLKIPRWLNILSGSKLEIYGFGDASKEATCAKVYFHILLENKSQVKLVVAKIKEALLESQTLPHLELCASLLLCIRLKLTPVFDHRLNVFR